MTHGVLEWNGHFLSYLARLCSLDSEIMRSAGKVVIPYTKKFLDIDSCLDHGGRWNYDYYFREPFSAFSNLKSGCFLQLRNSFQQCRIIWGVISCFFPELQCFLFIMLKYSNCAQFKEDIR